MKEVQLKFDGRCLHRVRFLILSKTTKVSRLEKLLRG